MGLYVVVARAHASAIFYPGERFEINFAHADWEPFRLVFQTRYDEAGYDAPVPKDLWVDIRGRAPDLPNSAHVFVNAAAEISNIIVLGVNATMGRLEPELVFDASPETNVHEFLQSFMPDWPLVPVPGRKIDVHAIGTLIGAVNSHQERSRVMRAITRYTEALRSWRPGNEIPCLAHLYMGVEAISKALSRDYLKRIGGTEDALAIEWGVKHSEKLTQRRKLESEYRRRLVFHGDTDTYTTARKVSDTFEHGFGDFGNIHKPAQAVIIKTARYLRHSIIDLLDLSTDDRAKLLSTDYEVARGPLMIKRFLRGELVGAADQLAPDDQVYPILTWNSKLKTVAIGDNGIYGFQTADKLTAKIGVSVQFRLQAHEIWDGAVLKNEPSPPPSEVIDVAVTTAESKNRFSRRIATHIRNCLLWVAAKLQPQ